MPYRLDRRHIGLTGLPGMLNHELPALDAAVFAQARELCRPLAERERQTLFLICNEYTFDQIAELMQVSPRTVESRCQVIYRKLGVQRAIGAAVVAAKAGLV